jgi:predicted RNA-binding Zn ribbon-like protein
MRAIASSTFDSFSVTGDLYLGGNRIVLRVNFLLLETSKHIAGLRLDGGHLALDFVNTMGGSYELPPEPHDEHLRSYGDLLAWGVRVELLDEASAERLSRAASGDPEEAGRVLGEAIEQREQAYVVLRALAESREPPAGAVSGVEDNARRALDTARLSPCPDGSYRWHWDHGDDLRSPLRPLAHATVELLADAPLDRLKRCAGCRWLFLDASKNRSRHWCSMEECGTHAKMRRYVERRRAARRGAPNGS